MPDEPCIAGPASRPAPRRRIAVVTGTRAEFGLLRPVMHAIRARADLDLLVVVAGAHLVGPARTAREVEEAFGPHIAARVPMQTEGRAGRTEDCLSLSRGIEGCARAFTTLAPHWIVVLGDRIEAFAAAIAGNVGGWCVAHIHGGDRAEGIADESMRHAITKLAHLHLAATPRSARRIVRMGERPDLVRLVGSPAIDGLDASPPMSDDEYRALGSPRALVLMHPIGRHAELEEADARAVIHAVADRAPLVLDPNLDAGREGILRAIEASGANRRSHLPRPAFIALLKRLRREGGLLIGNSSAALIEASALRLPAVDVGPRQAGREKPGNVVHEDRAAVEPLRAAVTAALALDLSGLTHPYGDGHAGERIAEALASIDPASAGLARKRCRY
jgi:UDP-hydrolysing UDP-N-acetyl-D-glucosamine 2-epimerase